MAHSVGAVAAAAWVHDYAPPIRGMILAVPAFRVKLYVPFAVSLLRLKQKIFGHGYVKSYVKAKMLTHDHEEAARYQSDSLIFPQISVNILLDLYDTSTRLLADAGAITVPTLMFEAGTDWVVKPAASRKFFGRLSSKVKRIEILPGFIMRFFTSKIATWFGQKRASSFSNALRSHCPGRPWRRPISAVSPRTNTIDCARREIRCSH